jgi:predicted metalloprotease with PDZ domain
MKMLSLSCLLVSLLAVPLLAQEEERIVENGETTSSGAWLGVNIKDVTPDLAKAKKLGVTEGVWISEVTDESPAEKAGLEDGDIIVAFDGKPVSSASDLQKAVKARKPGDKVDISVVRDGKKQNLSATLAPRRDMEKRVIVRRFGGPDGAMLPPAAFGMMAGGTPRYGFKLRTLNPQLGAYFSAPDGKGVLVEEIISGSAAEKAGFLAGDVIIKAGSKTVKRIEDFQSVLGAFDPGAKIPVDILRKGGKKTLELIAGEAEESDDMGALGAPRPPQVRSLQFRTHPGMQGGCTAADVDINLDLDRLQSDLENMQVIIDGKEVDLDELQDVLKEKLEDATRDLDVKVDGTRVVIKMKDV